MPKTFAQYSRYEKGINTRFDDADIGAEALADCNGWSINTFGEINTINYHENKLYSISQGSTNATSKPYIGSGFSGITVRSDFDLNNANMSGSFKEDGCTMFFYNTLEGGVGVVNLIEGGSVAHLGIFYTDAPATSNNYKASFLWHEGDLRWSNTTGDATSKPKWMGFMSRTRFSSDDSWNTLNKWVITDASVVAPVYPSQANNGNGLMCQTTDITTKLPNLSADLPNISFDITTTSEDGTWASTDYEFGATYVYKTNQESKVSLIKIKLSNNSIVESINLPKRQYFTKLAAGIKNTNGTVFDERMTGCRIYARKYNGGKRWRLLLDVDFERGSRLNTFDNFENTWTRQSAGLYYTSTYLEARSPSIETYEALTGVLNDEFKISMENNGTRWKDAVSVGRRIFYIGCKYFEETSFKDLNDRVFYSQPAKPDLIPISNWIDLGINDGDQFTAIQSFSGRLCLFKNNKVYILNVQSGSPAGWGMEQEIDNNGVPYQTNVIKTRYGIVWANRYGCFTYGGQGVQELSQSLSASSWFNKLGSNDNLILGMNNVTNQLYVATTNLSPNTALRGVWVYNFDSQGWSYVATGVFQHNEGFFNTLNGELHYHTKQNSKYEAITLNNDMASKSLENKIFTLKEDSLGSPGIMKRFYKVRVELRNENNATLALSANGGTEIAKSLSANADFVTKIYEFSPVIESDRLQLSFRSYASGGITISNITVEYRTKRLRTSEAGN